MTQKIIQILDMEGATFMKLFDNLQKKVDELKLASPDVSPDSFLTRQEVATLFKISLPTVHAWMNAGILKPYKIANKTRFLRGEVLAAATCIKQKGGSHE